jgi:hypothetical protein
VKYVLRLFSLPLKLLVAAIRHAWWLISLPFVAFDAMASRVVAPPVDHKPSREELRVQRDLEIEAIQDTPPPPAA